MNWRLLLILFAGPVGASSPYLPLDHWSYPLLEEVHNGGGLPGLTISCRPWTYDAIGHALEDQNVTGLSPWCADAVLMLRKVFAVDATSSLNLYIEAGDEFVSADSIGANWSARAGINAQTHRFSACVRAAGEQWYKSAPDSVYPWKQDRAAAVRFSDQYVKTDFEHFTAGIGRLNWFWGPFKRRSLVLSDNAFSFDHLFLQLQWRWMKLSQVTGELNRTIDIHRYITLHRLDLKLWRGLEVGLFESVLYQGENRGYSLRYVNPVGIYFLEQMNNQLIYEEDGNSLIGFDFSWRQRVANVRMQAIVDDFQVDNEDGGDQEPPAVGGIVGFDLFAPGPLFGRDRYLTFEFTKLTNRVYNTLDPDERYTYYSTGLADPNNDFENYYLSYTIRTSPPFAVWKPFIEFNRQGEGRINKNWGTVTEGGNLGFRDEKTPTGVVDESLTFGLETSYRPRPAIGVGFTLGYCRETNAGNIQDEDRQGPVVKLKVDAALGRVLGKY